MKWKYTLLKILLSLLQITLVTSNLSGQYCSSGATSTSDTRIDSIHLAGETVTINVVNRTSCQGYTDNTAVPAADLMIGQNYTVGFTSGTCGMNLTQSVSVYIDWNMDQDFDDIGEFIGNGGYQRGPNSQSLNFTAGACGSSATGLTRMRIVIGEWNIPTACGAYPIGETEDYTINVLPNTSIPISNQFSITGDAVQTSPECIRLTSATNNQLGMAWDVSNRLNFANSFSYDFQVNLGSNNGGADGIMFLIQNDDDLECVLPVGGWGAGNIDSSLCIEIDTYLNSSDRDDGLPGVGCVTGDGPDHLDIWLDGNINPFGNCANPGARIIPNAVALMDGGVEYDIENGLNHVFRITWTPGSPGIITASILNVTASITYGTVSYAFDPMVVFGTNTPMYGFSASTGGLNNEQILCIPSILLETKLISFNAELTDEMEVAINWEASHSDELDYFEVERSIDGIFFEHLALVAAKEQLNQIYPYQVIDPRPIIGKSYYRLKQVNAKGSEEYSSIRAVEYRPKMTDNIHVYPNPTTDHIRVVLEEIGTLDISIVNALGQVVKVGHYKNRNRVVVNTAELSGGIYYMNIAVDNKTTVVKIILR